MLKKFRQINEVSPELLWRYISKAITSQRGKDPSDPKVAKRDTKICRAHTNMCYKQDKRKTVKEFLDTLPHDNRAASGPDVIKRNTPIRAKTIAKNVQKPWIHNKIQALAGKQPEFDRGPGTQRNPSTPKQTVTGPNELGSMGEENQENHMKKIFKEIREANTPHHDFDTYQDWHDHMIKHGAIRMPTNKLGSKPGKLTFAYNERGKRIGTFEHDTKMGWLHESCNNEYNANMQLSSSKGSRKPGHYLMRHGVPLHNQPHATSQQALSAYHNLSDKSNVKIQHVKEEAPAMAAGAAGDPGHVQNASDNYASQRKRLSMFRRKNPLVGSNNNQNLNVGTTNEAKDASWKYIERAADKTGTAPYGETAQAWDDTIKARAKNIKY